MIKVIAFVDPMGGGGQSQEEEYEEIRQQLRKALQCEFHYGTDVPPWNLGNVSCDLYIFDYGGLLPGAESMIRSMYGSLREAIQEHPNTLFLIWSSYTANQYKDWIEYDLGESGEAAGLSKLPNLAVMTINLEVDPLQRVQAWFGITPEPVLHKVATPVYTDDGMSPSTE